MKHTLLIFGLLWALGASGQIYINSFTFGAAPAGGVLLDDYPNAAAAYSLRKLRSAYTGDCIVVRRSSNNDTLAIGFSGNYLDTAALKTFCASTDCFVSIWYDQSTNTRNATQTTTANQPRIARNGALLYFQGNQVINFVDISSSATQQRLVMPLYHVNTTQYVWNFAATATETGTNNSYAFVVGSNPNDRGFAVTNSTAAGLYTSVRAVTRRTASLVATFNGISLGNRYVQSAFADRTNIGIYVNGVASTFASDANVNFSMPTNYMIGNTQVGGVTCNIYIYELVFYATDQSSNRAGIEGNINSFYSIY